MVMNPVEDPTPLLGTSWTASDGHRSLRVSGELHIATAPVPAVALDGEIRPGSRLRLDVDDLVFVDAAGLRVLVSVRRTAGLTRRVVLHHPSPRVPTRHRAHRSRRRRRLRAVPRGVTGISAAVRFQ